MAEHDEHHDEDGADEPILTARDIMRARFHALGGGKLLNEEIKKLPPLADLVTDAHREMVYDLAASGLSNDAVARCMGISKERLQTLFAHEVETAYELAHATMARSLWINGAAGESGAALGWIRNHNRSNWASIVKTEKTDKGAEQATAETDALKTAGADLLSAVLTAMSTDKKLFKRPGRDKVQPVKVLQSDKPKPIKAGATLKRPKGD
jgi:hypothetical protein